MTDDELRALPPLLTVPAAGRVLGVGRTVAYRLVRRGEWPTPVIRVGGQIRVPRAPLLDLVGLSTGEPGPPPNQRPRRKMKQPSAPEADRGRHNIQEMLLP